MTYWRLRVFCYLSLPKAFSLFNQSLNLFYTSFIICYTISTINFDRQIDARLKSWIDSSLSSIIARSSWIIQILFCFEKFRRSFPYIHQSMLSLSLHNLSLSSLFDTEIVELWFIPWLNKVWWSDVIWISILISIEFARWLLMIKSVVNGKLRCAFKITH